MKTYSCCLHTTPLEELFYQLRTHILLIACMVKNICCPVCCKKILKHNRIICCNNCDRNIHKACTNLSEDEFEQINYETKESALTNGVKGRLVDEAIQQGHNKLDLLLMIDTSGSMRQEQENLSARLGPLLSHIADSDWQISIVASGGQNNSDCFRALIKKSDPDAEPVYRSQVTAGTNGYTFEHGIRNALLGLKGECPNGQTPWVRDGSTLSVLFVSDEDDCSKGTCPDQVDWRTEIVNHVNSIREKEISK